MYKMNNVYKHGIDTFNPKIYLISQKSSYLIRDDASTAARGGDILRATFSSCVWLLLLDVCPEAELALGLVTPELPPFRSISDLHLPAPYGSSIEQLNESPRRPAKF